ncbi:transporter substrate-binding domain-containing protein [Hahella aquimaris]|uniref:substrate-binding periplasmic protein n=1 Tax=Hahella sp. HNIBRBA332 TaxID=3015983 RepID=UPI00273B2813|nr:transporter substrate-binding domain-containing protein [Hahella sp. HNIBRBA332]WLQ17042.1 transporter substrate-binding domain-containing protein [Hahella sp. HNIBRBA332]
MKWFLVAFCCWLASLCQAKTLLVGMEAANNSPFEYIDETAQLTGFHVEIMRAVAARLGWDIEFRRHPWKRAMKELEEGGVHAVTFVAISPERQKFADFLPDNLLHVSRTTIYIRRDRSDEIRYEPPLEQFVWRWRTAAASGYYMSDQVIDLIRRKAPIEQPTVNQSQLFIMLISNRFDAIFGATSAIERARAEIAGLDEQVQRLDGALFPGKRMYAAFSRKAPDGMAEEFAEAYRLYRMDSAYEELKKRFGMEELAPSPTEFQ